MFMLKNSYFYRPSDNHTRIRNSRKKNLTIFIGCHYSRFYMMVFSSFPKIKTKNLNLDLYILLFLLLGTISPAGYRLWS